MSTYKRGVVFDQVYPYLVSIRTVARAEHDQGESTEAIDVRVGFYTDTGDVGLVSGDVSFDTEHFEHCAASSVAWNDTNAQLRATARELLDQLEDSIAESEG